MKKILTQSIFLFSSIFISCELNENFSPPITGIDKEYSNLQSLKEISRKFRGDIIKFDTDITTYGYVISNDREGNFFKKIIIQDKPENPTIGVEIRIDDTNLNTKYNLGRKVYIKLNGLSFGKNATTFQIGIKGRNSINRIGLHEYSNFIDRSSEIVEFTPTTVKITDLNDDLVNTLVKINKLQPETKGLTYGNAINTNSENRFFNNCETFQTIIMQTSGFANFKTLPIPNKNGSITGILNKFENDYVISVRDLKDVLLTEEYGCNITPQKKNLTDIKSLFTGNETRITENSKIKVIITSDLTHKNITNNKAFAQDLTAGIALKFSDTHNLNLGDEIEISVGGLKLNRQEGLLQLKLKSSNIINVRKGRIPSPEKITIEQALSGNFESKLVEIHDVQFKNNTKTYGGMNTLTSDCVNSLTSYVNDNATFATNKVSVKKGKITGIMSTFNGVRIYLRNKTDIKFTENYDCGANNNDNDLFFSEYVEGSSNNKYIEIYNDTGTNIDLSNYQIWGSSNGGGWKSARQLQLSGNLAANKTYVISANKSVSMIIDNSDLSLPYESPVHHNGNDAIALAKRNNIGIFKIIDIIGNPDDNPGVAWDVAGVAKATKDHTLIRKLRITKGNTNWVSSAGTNSSNSEWNIKEKDHYASIGKR
ncbi:DUF5689 domain-containing protein [Tenacibaculum sp. nBUS_03]|uniref:DUF5689 domain-containing protein n=1 Tax=Tenacibaculum sp. nBUS_03 TaxID=3395320 RepID=UPI003EBBF4C7